MQTTKTQTIKADSAARLKELKDRELSNKEKEVKYRNILNKKANQVEKELRDFFLPLVGKKIRTISGSGSWSKLVSSSLNGYIEDLRKDGFTLRCRYSAGSLMFEIHMHYQAFRTDLFSQLDHTSSICIDVQNIYVGSWDESTGKLYKLAEEIDINERKTDWTVNELASIRKQIIETRENLMSLESSICDFRR